MSLFDVIKYGNIDIQSETELNELPPEVVKKWHARVVEHACQSAESIAHQDTSGKCQKLIDMTRKYMSGEVDKDALLAEKKTASYLVPKAYSTAAHFASNAAYTPVNISAYCAANAVRNAAYPAKDADYAAIQLYKEWLIEELMNYDTEECVN